MLKTSIAHLFIFFIVFSTMACRWSGEIVHDSERIPILTEDAVALSEKLEQAVEEADRQGTFTLEVTEQQLTSYVAMNLEYDSQFPITDLQIRLRDEQIWISGVVHQDDLQLPLSVGVRPDVDAANNLELEFTEARIGVFPLPQIMLESITKEVEKAFVEQVARIGEGYFIQEISIGEGSILIRGAKR